MEWWKIKCRWEIPRLSMIKFKVNLNIVKKLLHSYIYTGIYLFCSESLMQKVIWVCKNFLTSSLAQLDYVPQILTLLHYKCFKGSGPLVAHSKSHKVFPIKKTLIIWYILGTTCSTVYVLKYDSYKISSLEVIGLNFSGNITFYNSLVYVYKTQNFLTWHLNTSNLFKFV